MINLNLMKTMFVGKWKKFKQFDSCKFDKCKIRYLRKRDNLMLIKSDGLLDYIQIRFKDDKQFNKLLKLFNNDKYVQINIGKK